MFEFINKLLLPEKPVRVVPPAVPAGYTWAGSWGLPGAYLQLSFISYVEEAKFKSTIKTTADIELFHEYLTSFQQEEFKRTGWVPVCGSKCGIYFVGMSCVRADTGSAFCLVFQEQQTSMDVIIGRKLLLEADEKHFLAVANKIPIYRFP